MIFPHYLEDLPLRQPVTLGAHTFMPEDVKRFARTFDAQPFHMDEEAARQSHFGALCASGWHSASGWMRAAVLYRRKMVAACAARGETVAAVGVSPGFRDLHWHKPVYAGDTLTYAAEVTGTRVSKSRPGWGIAECYCTGTNQRGELAIAFTSAVFVQRRPQG